MIRILVVDDEEMVRDGLCDIIEYLGLDSAITIDTAIDGEDALQKIHAEQPDIVITDLNMPKMDGLALIHHIVSQLSKIKVIVISGYDEFHLVKESFKLGVTDYLLKPVHTEELREALMNSIDSLEEEQRKQTLGKAGQCQSWIEKSSQELNFILDQMETEEIQFHHLFEKQDILFPHSKLMVLIITVLERHAESVSWQMKLAVDLMNEYPVERDTTMYPLFNHNHDLVLWINFNGKPDLKTLLYRIKSQYSDTMFIVSCGQVVDSIGHIQEAYRTSYEVSKYKVVSRAFTILDESVYEQRKQVIMEADDLKWLVEIIDLSKVDEVQPFINRYFHDDRLKQYTFESLENMYATVMQIIQWLPSKRKNFYSFEQPEQLRIYLKTCIFQTIDARRELLSSSNIVEVAKRYVHEHLLDEINMAVVANYCNVNYHHFSKLFKEAIGINFQDYITQCRMEYAKKALQGLNIRINEVASQLGYSNPKNFTRVFKNYYGTTPKSYQESLNIK